MFDSLRQFITKCDILLQNATYCYKMRQLFYYKMQHLLQIAAVQDSNEIYKHGSYLNEDVQI